jgi:hypothetical protein
MKKLLRTAVLTAAVLMSACGSKTGSGAASPIAGGSSTSSSATTATTTAASSSSVSATTAASTATTTGTSSSSAATGSTVKSTGTAAETPLAGFTPRSFDIRHFHFDAKKAYVSSLDPYKYDDKAQTPDPAKKWLYVFGNLTNKLNFTEDYVDPREVSLSLGTKVIQLAGNPVGGVGQTVTRGATSKDGAFAFEVTDEKLDAPVIVVNQPGKQQEKYALTGTATEAPFPKPVVIPPTGSIPLEDGKVINLTFGKATAQNYVGFDDNGSSIKSGVALMDHRWLYITFEASYTKPPDGNSSVTLGSDLYHLVVDGKRQTADVVYAMTITNVDSGTTVKGYAVIDVPTTGALEIEWGKVGGVTTKFPVTLPA